MLEPSDYYQDTVAVVTGAASGIGAAIAELLLAYGASRVVLADVNAADVKQQSTRLEDAHPGRALAVCCDVTDEAEVQSMIRDAAVFGDGRIDLLVNNAGAGFSGSFEEHSNADWEQAFALNFYGPLYGIRAVLPIMRAHGGGQIVNVISGIAFSPMAFQTRYAATKAALNALTLALRYELWDEHIRVSSATPDEYLLDVARQRRLGHRVV
jgi:NAD(P)-dependent dehydrogenase (short-subunit alcohol dehydrogenase family)